MTDPTRIVLDPGVLVWQASESGGPASRSTSSSASWPMAGLRSKFCATIQASPTTTLRLALPTLAMC